MSRILQEMPPSEVSFETHALRASAAPCRPWVSSLAIAANRRWRAADGFRRARKAHGSAMDQKRAQASTDIEVTGPHNR